MTLDEKQQYSNKVVRWKKNQKVGNITRIRSRLPVSGDAGDERDLGKKKRSVSFRSQSPIITRALFSSRSSKNDRETGTDCGYLYITAF